MLYAERGRESLLEYAVLDLKYSEPAARRRISAMRAIREMPEIEEKISSGALNLSTVNQAQTVIRQNEKALGQKATVEEKKEILQKIEGLSFEKSKRALTEACPAAHPEVQEKVKPSANGTFKLETTLSPELYAVLEEIQDLEGRRIEIKALLLEMAIERRDKLRKKRGVVLAKSDSTASESNSVASKFRAPKSEVTQSGASKSTSTSTSTGRSKSAALASTSSKVQVSTSAPSDSTLSKTECDLESELTSATSVVIRGHQQDSSMYQSSGKSADVAEARDQTEINSTNLVNSVNNRNLENESSSSKRKYISVKIDRANRARAGHRCEYTDPETGVRCSARRHLETEHKISVTHGGDDSLENLQLYCAAHNKLKAAQQLGFDFMAEFVPSLN